MRYQYRTPTTSVYVFHDCQQQDRFQPLPSTTTMTRTKKKAKQKLVRNGRAHVLCYSTKGVGNGRAHDVRYYSTKSDFYEL
jgi:hypothetical protein